MQALGGEVYTNLKEESLLVSVNGRNVYGVQTADGKEWHANHTMLAVFLHAAKKLLKSSFPSHESFQSMFALPTMDAVTFQIDMKTPLMEKDITTFGPGTCLASFTEQSRTTFQQAKGRLSIIMTPSERFTALSENEILDIVLQIRLPLDKENVVKYRKIVHFHDFYHLGPGHHIMRPSQKTPIRGLTLA